MNLKTERLFIAAALTIPTVFWFTISLQLRASGHYDSYDTLFDADPSQYISRISNGWPHSFIHPGYELLTGLPIRAMDLILSATGIITAGQLRSIAPYALPPLLGYISAFIFWLTLKNINISTHKRLAFTLLFALGFSQQIFSIVPESYSLSGLVLSLCLLHLSQLKQIDSNPTRRDEFIMAALCATASAITITNGLLLAIAYSLTTPQKATNLKKAKKLVILTVIVLASITITDKATQTILSTTQDRSIIGVTKGMNTFRENYSTKKTTEILKNLAWTSINLINAITPTTLSTKNNNDNKKYLTLSQPELPNWILIILASAGWAGLLYLAKKLNQTLQEDETSIAIWCLSIIGLNSILHSYFGREFFLYSQHWYHPLMLMLALIGSRTLSTKTTFAICGLIAAVNTGIIFSIDMLLVRV